MVILVGTTVVNRMPQRSLDRPLSEPFAPQPSAVRHASPVSPGSVLWLVASLLTTVLPAAEFQTAYGQQAIEPAGAPHAAAPAIAASPLLQRFEFHSVHMAVEWKIVVFGTDADLTDAAARAAFARVREIDRGMSNYDSDSELSRLCQTYQPGVPTAISADLATVFTAAQQQSALSQGAFDITIGPLADLWRKARRNRQLPSVEALSSARLAVGFQHITVTESPATVSLAVPGMRLDVGAIAKGYAADAALAVLRDRGLLLALVEGGGDIALGGAPPGATGWRILASGEQGPAAPPVTLLLANCGVATSGSAFKFLELGGQRYSHLIDPRSGMAITHSHSVTVVARDGMTADALASSLSVLPSDEELELISDLPGTAARISTLDGQPARTSPGWDALLAAEQPAAP